MSYDDASPPNTDAVWDRWEEVDALFEQALDHGPEDREEFLKTACGDDTSLLRAVQSLVRVSAEAGGEPVRPGPDLIKAAFRELPEHAEESAESLIGALVVELESVG